jgi:hypothetical protein
MTFLIFYKQLSIEEGFEVLEQTKFDRLVGGRQVSQCSGWNLFKNFKGKPIRCWHCGCEADRWIADRGPKHQGSPVLNLYGMRYGELVLMNRDHIIPKSLGGVDDVANLRPACEVCNGDRGNTLDPDELQFRKDNPHLIDRYRLEVGQNNARKAIKLHDGHPEEQARIALPFDMIGEPL